jgi:CrcB protein
MDLTTLGGIGLLGLAGALGAVTRYLVGRIVAQRTRSTFPWGTLLINGSGAFLIGLVAGLASRKLLTPLAQTMLATGFLGGYTTFSTMAWEGMQLARGGSLRQSIVYLGGNILPGVLAAALGLWLGAAW